MRDSEAAREYRPELIPRRGEWFAWGTALLLGGAWLFLSLTGNPVHGAMIFLGILLFLAAMSVSLGNWMDRMTRIVIEQDGITYENGLRKSRMAWQDIRQVQVFPSKWGDKVRVIGSSAAFAFRTLGEVKVQGDTKGRMGFEDGKEILEKILTGAEMHEVEAAGTTVSGARYYARE